MFTSDFSLENQHKNFYLIELKNEGLSSIFSTDHNLRFFLAASNEFDSDIESIVATENVVKRVKEVVGPGLLTVEKYNPLHFPIITSEEMLMEVGPDGLIQDIHPNVAKVTLITLHEQSVLQARSIGVPSPIGSGRLQ
jgi:hypothetical protein